MATSVDVAVVGAGAAGLTACFEIIRRGFSCKILEADAMYGGRLQKREGFTNYPIDIGAEWLHVPQSVLNDIAAQDVSGTITTVTYAPDFYLWDGSSFKQETYVPSLEEDRKFVDYTWFDFFQDFIVPTVTADIELNCQVTSIDYSSSDSATTTCANGKTVTSQTVVVTVPISVLKQSTIDFVPNLPSSTLSAINDIEMLDGLKVFMKFSSNFYLPSFWIQEFGLGEHFYYDQTFGQTTSDNILGYFCVGTEATRLVSLTDEQIKDDLLAQLDAVFSNQATPNLLDYFVQNWSAETYIQGAYSYDVQSSIDTLQTAVGDRICFGGEAIPVDFENGYCHGAAWSGRAAASQCLNIITGESSPPCFSEWLASWLSQVSQAFGF